MFRAATMILSLTPILFMAAVPSLAAPFDSAPVAETALSEIAGRAGNSLQVIADNRAVVADNHINGISTTGGVSIDGNAFQGLNGLAVVNANTGNNVAINSSLNVNVVITPH